MEEFNGSSGAGKGFSGDAGKTAALAANCYVEALVALIAELLDGNVLTNLYAGAHFHTDLLHDVNFGLYDVLVQLV